MHAGPVLTGATGYIGSRLLRVLEEGGCMVRCFARQPDDRRRYLKRRGLLWVRASTVSVVPPSWSRRKGTSSMEPAAPAAKTVHRKAAYRAVLVGMR